LSTEGPGASASIRWSPPNPNNGNMATVSTTIPIPPNQWVVERQNKIDLGRDSISVRIEAPVVVKPDIVSKNASV